jgi:hypothetical protein
MYMQYIQAIKKVDDLLVKNQSSNKLYLINMFKEAVLRYQLEHTKNAPDQPYSNNFVKNNLYNFGYDDYYIINMINHIIP